VSHVVVECPTGLVVVLRKFKVKDEDLLTDPKTIRNGAAVNDLLEAITHKVEETGPYRLREPRKKKGETESYLDWNDVLQGDRMTVLLKNRIHTWGPELEFSQPCTNCPNKKVEIEIDLNDLVIKPLPEESIPHVLDPGAVSISRVLPGCGVKVSFRLLRGDDEKKLIKLQKQKKDSQSSSYFRFRITEIEGVPQNTWIKWIEDLDADDSAWLRAAFDEADCGVDQEVQFECEDCGFVWLDDVRFRADFLFPKYRRKSTSKT